MVRARMSGDQIWVEIGRYAKRAPSPHNTQPYRLRIVGDREAEVIFLPRRGLYVADPRGRFTCPTGGCSSKYAAPRRMSSVTSFDVAYDYSLMYPCGDYETPQTGRATISTPI